MNRVPRSRFARWLGIGAVLALAGALFALLAAWSGIVNISASAGHPAWVESFLELGMRRSVERHSSDLVPPPDLDSPDRILLGASHFAGGCAECHGEPGAGRNPIYDYMLPFPPDLATAANAWNARELYFIVRHGLQFTGMPEWSGGERADEVWSMVAFLQQLPMLDAGDYRVLASGNRDARTASEEEIAGDGIVQLARTACDRCHDTAQSAPPSALVPRLAGQPAAFIARSLREYKRGIRRSGFMQPVAAMLDEPQIAALAAHYSELPRVPVNDALPELSTAQRQEAAAIADGTHPELRLPACLSCHGRDARADYPVLTGQQAPYIAQQLRLFRSGGRATSAWGEVMNVIAARLDPGHIDVLAQWFAQQETDAE
ncbi:MAG: c-type cytochrome [Gammaproteobacteria bacterium]